MLESQIDSIEILEKVFDSNSSLIKVKDNSGSTLLSALERQSFGAIRSGGPSVLSTSLNRGMASRHLGILWSGFNIQSVVNGTFDLNLLSNTFDRVNMYTTATTAVTGNASMAGAISLNNRLFQPLFTNIGIQATSTNNFGFTIVDKSSLNRYTHHLAISGISNDNSYSFYNNNVKQTQEFATFSMWDINYQGNVIVSKKLNLKGGLWLQNANRLIPPTKTSVAIKQEQEDINYRGSLQLNYYISDVSEINIRTAFFDETIIYETPGIFSKAQADISNFALDYFHHNGLNLSIQYRRDEVDASFFEPIHRRSTTAVLANYKKEVAGYGGSVYVRPEWVDGDRQPLVIGLQIKKDLSKQLEASITYNKGYTLPSFNDLYWPTGGNEDLKTERSHELDLGLSYSSVASKKRVLSANVFINLIDDWIQWTPINGFFEPVNQRKIRNLSTEIQIKDKFKVGCIGVLQMRLQYTFTDSRLVEHFINSNLNGNRSIFVPAHKFSATLSYIYNGWRLNLYPLYYSKRFDTVDNSSHVPGFVILDAEITKDIQFGKNSLAVAIGIENSLNNDYENIRFYPMPLRVFRIGLNYKLKK